MKLERIPKPTHGSLDWLEKRWRDDHGRCVFGASDAPALMNASPYKTRAGLFVDKMNKPTPSVDSAVFRRGNLLEPVLLKEAGERLGVEIITPNVMYRNGRFTISKDGVDNEANPTIGVEAKTTTRYSVTDASDLPQEYLWQGWAQQLVLQIPIWFVVLDRNQTISVVELPENEKALQALRDEAELVGEAVDQQVTDLSIINAEFTADEIAGLIVPQPTSVELPADAMNWINALEDAKHQKKQGEQMEQTAKDALANLLMENEIGTINGVPVISWKQTAGRKSFDSKTFQQDNPTLYDNYSKIGKPFRTMRVLIKGDN